MLGSCRSARYPRKSCTQTTSSSRRTRAGLEIDGGALSRSWSKLHLTLGQKFCHPVNSTCPILVTARHLFPLPSIASYTMWWKPFFGVKFSDLITCIFPRFCCAVLFLVVAKFQDVVKFIYSEKATKFCEISTLLLSYVVPVKSLSPIHVFSCFKKNL